MYGVQYYKLYSRGKKVGGQIVEAYCDKLNLSL